MGNAPSGHASRNQEGNGNASDGLSSSSNGAFRSSRASGGVVGYPGGGSHQSSFLAGGDAANPGQPSSSGLREALAAREAIARKPAQDIYAAPDLGFLEPVSNVYANAPATWDHPVVHRLIESRKLAPFYRGLDGWEEGMSKDDIDSLLDAVVQGDGTSHRHEESEARQQKEITLYFRTAECPICFLNYPPNINFSRCCDQALCTECFVYLKRNDPTPQHAESEAVACPFCVEPNFGVIYTPPQLPITLASPELDSAIDGEANASDFSILAPDKPSGPRRKSISHTAPEVVLTDTIYPDWEDKLAIAKATAARRANRRIIFRQVGDRMVPLGVTSSRSAPGGLFADDGADGSSSRRSRRQRSEHGPMTGADLEELMIMEAMRISLLEQEERERKERAERDKAAAQQAAEPSTTLQSAATTSTAPLTDRNDPSQGLPPSIISSPARSAGMQGSIDRTAELQQALGDTWTFGNGASGSSTPSTSHPPAPQQRQAPVRASTASSMHSSSRGEDDSVMPLPTPDSEAGDFDYRAIADDDDSESHVAFAHSLSRSDSSATRTSISTTASSRFAIPTRQTSI
ncbi:uncharacterized protein L969DRAFT_52583 [Mixia osmundae IAM 14324]|uniref:RING-type domain-containing protein n=1 Tax=Mixia osmundae (strain CBS 9802 / IAM 14324 / JCM 22182 / KY 12970) TaxID=764103 RepID=G7E4V5_MIXOS|nr:uncharacterized protein L969DRAFT_52583 [Mixia osmundae IAM 14324]KEI37728.1 hypothetical protein L969DRAFT_52583 [Mixia osmundae IAM 14324]GAA97865.1 hypothetical protein E5Q_04545 [Mixia osmundae IAM 14324]